MLMISIAEINAWIGSFLLPFFRVSSIFMIMPVFGSSNVPTRIRVLLSVFITVAILGVLPPSPTVDPFSFTMLMMVFSQMVIGLCIGFVLKMVFEVFVFGAQVVSMQMGLGFAAMIDPMSGLSIPLISQFYILLVTLTFLALDGHLMAIRLLVDSFTTMPISLSPASIDLWRLISWSSWIFKGGLSISLPAVISVLVVNLSFGIMTRAAPQFNIISVGFSITLIMGFLILLLTIFMIMPHVNNQMDLSFELIKTLIRK